tara:strand:+ start:21 stop:1226 length:1206 start_codon:yes stop_codon:yes gene_type:complete
MSILSVDTISPIGSGTTVTLNATETKVNNFITVGTGASISSPSSNVLTLGTNNNEGLRLLSNGNVLIGTTVDGNQALNVYGASNAALVIQNSNTGTGANNGLYIGNGNGGIAYFWNYENDQIRLATNNVERIRITNTGKIGIGAVIEPTVAFEVRGSDASHYLRVENTNSSSAYTALSLKTTGVDFQIWNQGPAGGSYAGTNGIAFYQGLISGSYGPFTFYHGTSRRMSVDTDGDVTINDGNLVVASGHGIDFSATGNAGGMSNELLSDYEEGTWTPSFTQGVSGGSYSQQAGLYTKVGRLVMISARIDGNGLSANGDHLLLGGLPFTTTSGSGTAGGIYFAYSDNMYSGSSGTNLALTIIVNNNATVCEFFDGDGTQKRGTDFYDVNRNIHIVGTYHASS